MSLDNFEIIVRQPCRKTFENGAYLSAFVDEHEMVRASIPGKHELEEVILFSATFEGKPTYGGLFICAGGEVQAVQCTVVRVEERL